VSAPTINAARRETSARAAAHATGTVSTPQIADSDRSPASWSPNTRDHTHATQ